ncbi:hypothetical protein O4H66_12400 [Comamonadaceae bacterium G21597-S1]|nr:hypothetical protein [Comamonadaceae bacterium G21597-S1]
MMLGATATAGARNHGLAAPMAVAIAILIASLAYLALKPAQKTEPPVRVLPHRAVSPATISFMTAPVPQAPSALATPEVVSALPVAVAPRPVQRAALAPANPPYRFIGRTSAGERSSIVLFGRGRVLTLDGPGPIDDEYVVEAMFDDYLVLRHVQSGAGTFLQYGRRQRAIQTQQDPEEIPYD